MIKRTLTGPSRSACSTRSGTMAISETSLRDVLLFTFDEINAGAA
jgi:hypothetical protein